MNGHVGFSAMVTVKNGSLYLPLPLSWYKYYKWTPGGFRNCPDKKISCKLTYCHIICLNIPPPPDYIATHGGVLGSPVLCTALFS